MDLADSITLHDEVGYELSSALSRRRNNTKLLHHAQIVPHPPMFDGFAVPKADEMHVILSSSRAELCRKREGQVGEPSTTDPSDSGES